MLIPVSWISYRSETPNRGYWDYQILEDLISGRMWRPVSMPDFSDMTQFPYGQGGIVVLPARHHATYDYAQMLNHDMSSMPWVVLMLMGDEESVFPIHLIRHPNIRIWRQMARPDDPHVHHRLLNGYTPHTRLMDGRPCPEKIADYFFAGQVTHNRRKECVEAVKGLWTLRGAIVETPGFTQGLSVISYMDQMERAKVVPCPSGPVSPDTFRFAEALEAGCIPLADDRPPIPYPGRYWESVLGEDYPIHVFGHWNLLPKVMEHEILPHWPANANRIGAWWMNYKRQMSYNLRNDIVTLMGQSLSASYLDDQVTVLIATSPCPDHPDTAHLDRVIDSVRFHFPLAEIILMCDGVRPELEHRRGQYEEYLRWVIWKCQRVWHNVLPIVFDQHLHQAAMMRIVLENDRWVDTPLVLFCEHDTPIVKPHEYISWEGIQPDTGRPIEWGAIFKLVLTGESNMVRLYHRASIPQEHQWLMDGKIERHGTGFVKTRQWSQRPHVASTDFYRRILLDYFSPEARTFVEDGVQTKIYERPWDIHKLHIYWPGDNEAMRSWHSEARCGKDGSWDPKFEEKLKY